MGDWDTSKSEEIYSVSTWSGGHFSVGPSGNLCVSPEIDLETGEPRGPVFDMRDLIEKIKRRGIATPLLVRFDGILRSRVREIHAAFARARSESGYGGGYCGVYPIKVNQQRHVVEALLEEGARHGMGLEVGSKPELLAAIPFKTRGEMTLVCNGYKDREYVETALLSSRLEITPILVVEKYTELATIIDASKRLGIRPTIGVRMKPWVKGSGRWKDSSGDRAKFGLTTRQIVHLVDALRRAEMLDCLQLLHFHIGSQITNIRSIKNTLREATRTLLGLHELGVHVRWFDVGGGLGIDYDGSNSSTESSVNYTLQEYANDVVYQLHEACEEGGLEPPTIVTESGRALTAHHAVLVTEVLGVSEFVSDEPAVTPEESESEIVEKCAALLDEIHIDTCLEDYHDALQLREEAMMMFNLGQLSLPERASVEEYFWRACGKILGFTRTMDFVPDDLAALESQMADTYYLNFSLFQSVPDSWAINQLFPIVPLQRLDQEPTRRAILADITCDSDGKIDRFVDQRDEKRTLELHPWTPTDEPYYLGIFLVGAYQEILGDMHNLFGDPNIVHIDADEQGRPSLTHVVRGDRTQEVLSYVEYFEQDLLHRLRGLIEHSLDRGQMTYEESAALQSCYEAGLASYTYLVSPGASTSEPPRDHAPQELRESLRTHEVQPRPPARSARPIKPDQQAEPRPGHPSASEGSAPSTPV